MRVAERGSEFRPGDVVGGTFRVEALLGQGGAASVYRVKDERDGRKLALKQLQPPSDERRALVASQFEREYHTLSQLAHPRIIEVYDYGFERGSAFYTMELLDGEDLHERGKLPWRRACALLCDVASSLAIVHSRGLVHRDVSARNVRCTGDGRAKLIDFGAMAAMGVPHRVVGTPPFVPPEALQLQALDGRADLYGLGALAYWTLTGRYAYPAHTFNQLRDLWRNPPVSPSLLDAELPAPLCDLVLSLLRLDRAERPRTAADVMERLSGIASLPLQELPQVSRAYLIMPKLIGRDEAVGLARAALLEAAHKGTGASVLIEGGPGSGRSRWLEASILEAKLMGAVVLRGSASDAADGEYAVARTLGVQLMQALPELALQNAQPRASLLASVLPQLSVAGAAQDRTVPERRHIQAALRDWVLAISRTKHIVMAVDDLDAIDEPSAAWLGALSHGAKRRRLTLLLTARADAPASSALNVVRDLSRCASLPNLAPDQTQALLRSLFGDAERLVLLADRIHHLTGGVPQRIMALAEHLVARGVARYEAGSWALPIELSPEDLPQFDREALARRIAQLPAPAQRLAEALSLTDPSALSLPDYAALSEDMGAGRGFRALDALVGAGVLVVEGERYRLVHPDALSTLEAALPDRRKRELHARLAQRLAGTAWSSQRQLHMLRGGREQEAIDELLATPIMARHPGLLEALQCAVETAERQGLSLRTQLQLRNRLVNLAPMVGHLATFDQYGWQLIARLQRDSGLLDWLELNPTADPAARLDQALHRARERHQHSQGSDQGLPPEDSLTQLVAVYASCATIASITRDVTVIERLHSLKPFAALSPAIALVDEVLAILVQIQTGRYTEAVERVTALVAKLHEPWATTSSRLVAVRRGQNMLLGILKAARGDESYLESLSDLDYEPGHRGNAWRIRMLYDLAFGNLQGASDCRRRAELLDLQDSGTLALPGTTVGNELIGYNASGDVLGIKRVIDRLEGLAALYPGWRPALCVARAAYKRRLGDPQAALEALQPGLAAVAPKRHIDWPLVMGTQISLLLELGRGDEAIELGLHCLQLCAQLDYQDGADWLTSSVAEALARAGEPERARDLLDPVIERRRKTGYRGLALAMQYENRTRIAIGLHRETETRHYLNLALEEYALSGGNPNLRGRQEQLRRDAEAAFPSLREAMAPGVEAAAELSDLARTVYSRMLTCITPSERATRGLQLLLEATGAQAGYLFGLRSGGLQCLANADESEPSDVLTRMLDDYLRRHLESELPGDRPERANAAAENFIDEMGREFEPLLLAGTSRGEQLIAGAAALHFTDDDRPEPRRAMLDAVIDALIAQDVVDPITCVA